MAQHKNRGENYYHKLEVIRVCSVELYVPFKPLLSNALQLSLS